MSKTAPKIGGQIVAQAKANQPDYSFGAMVHSGADVHLFLFVGRELAVSARLAPGGQAHRLFEQLQAETAAKVRFFKRQPYVTARVCVRARGQKLSWQVNFEDPSAFLPEDRADEHSFDIVMRDDFPDPTQGMYRDPLPKSATPTEIAWAFMEDHTTWNTFAFAEDEIGDSESRWNEDQSYAALITQYCGPDKQHQPLAMGSVAPFDPERATIMAERIEGSRAIVETCFKDPNPAFGESYHRFEFARDEDGGGWRLVEVWYDAGPDDSSPCL